MDNLVEMDIHIMYLHHLDHLYSVVEKTKSLNCLLLPAAVAAVPEMIMDLTVAAVVVPEESFMFQEPV